VSAYTTSKFGVRAFSESLREALADVENVDVCMILPACVDTPIFRHAGNYTEYAAKPVPPIADPDRAVKATLGCIEHPKREVTVGQFGHLEAVIQEVLSGPFNWLAPYVMNRGAFGSEPSEVGPGNVFEPMPEWNQITGGWRGKRNAILRRTAFAGGAALTPLLAYWLMRRRG